MQDEAPHILVVDDDDRLRNLLRRYLTEQGFRVTTAGDVAQARDKLRSLAFDRKDIEGDRIVFCTRTRSDAGGESRELLHRYSATGGGRELSFVLQSAGGFDSHVPVTFVARRVVA